MLCQSGSVGGVFTFYVSELILLDEKRIQRCGIYMFGDIVGGGMHASECRKCLFENLGWRECWLTAAPGCDCEK